MDTSKRKPGGLLDQLIKASRGGADEAPRSATVEEVAELLTYDGAGGVVEARRSEALDKLWGWRRQGDLDFKETGPEHDEWVRHPLLPGGKPTAVKVKTYEVEAADLLKVKDWCKRADLWPDLADLWCHPVPASTGEQAPTEQPAEWVSQADAFDRLETLGLVPDDATAGSYFRHAATAVWLKPAIHPDRETKGDTRLNMPALVGIAREKLRKAEGKEIAQGPQPGANVHLIGR
jgi:hypothetical protein